MFSQHQINSYSRVKFCKRSNRFVIIFITDSVSSSSGCSRCLHSTDNVFYRDIVAITTLWQVECFLWSMGVHELEIYVTLLLINFVHQTNPPQGIVHARDVRWWCNVTNISLSWNFEVMDVHKRVILTAQFVSNLWCWLGNEIMTASFTGYRITIFEPLLSMAFHCTTNSITPWFPVASCKENPLCFDGKVLFMGTYIKEVLEIFMLPTTAIRNIIDLCDVWEPLLQEFHQWFLNLANKTGAVCALSSEMKQRECVGGFHQHLCSRWLGEALYLVLDQILVVLWEVPKHHNLICTERFLLWFDLSCLGFCQVRVLSKVVDAVDEEYLVFFECCCEWSQCSTICCLPLTIMEFRVNIQVTELIIQELFQSSTFWTWLTAMHHTCLVIWVTDNVLY